MRGLCFSKSRVINVALLLCYMLYLFHIRYFFVVLLLVIWCHDPVVTLNGLINARTINGRTD